VKVDGVAGRPFLIITSIAAVNSVMRECASQCLRHDVSFIVVGDAKSPSDFSLEGCDFLSLEDRLAGKLKFPLLCPTNHYARKNIGYLAAMSRGASLIIETDDDNLPTPSFWGQRNRRQRVSFLCRNGWVNVYRYFNDALIWPRGLPLDEIHAHVPSFDELPINEVDCPIQQGLADSNPDVDAIYRLLFPLPQYFRADRRIALGSGSWCPFNSQNTTWWPDAFPLLYLPSYCSFRITDIWRSLIAQRLAWLNGWYVLFHEPTVIQERNEHSLIGDFKDEVPGYLYNRDISGLLSRLSLLPGVDRLPENLLLCYRALANADLVGEKEIPLLERWLEDCRAVRGS
jgi:hypothetical protein